MACKYTYNGVEYSKEQLVSKLGNENSNFNTLYNNLVNEITSTETGRKILDRIKRDYVNKGIEPFNKWVNRNINASYVYKNDNSDYEKYVIKEYFEKTSKSLDELYTLEEQQEEAIVELLGLMTAEKLDAVKDGKLISLLKRLLKEIKAFVKDLFKQREVEIDKLPDDMTLGDLSDLLAYSNSKLILPGYEVKYTTPDNKEFKTYAEASKHISNLAKSVKEVDLNNIKINEFNNIPDEFETPGGIAFKKDDKYYLKELYPNFDEEGNFINERENIIEISKDRFISQYKDSFDYHLYDRNLSSFIEKNKEYEQSKEIIEEWKKVNNIRYNPEEIYSRGQEFSSVVGAYSSFDVNLMMQNLLHHIEDNEKAGGKFAISAYTKPIDKKIGHLEGGGGKIKFKIYPQSEDILWAANRDVYSGSVWDASEKVNKDKKSELLGVSYTKYPSLSNTDAVQPNLASIVDDLSYHHNELGIVLTGSNFRLEYDDNIPYQTKKIIDSINSILDQKYGKLVTPEIKRYEGKIVKYGVFSESANDILEEFKTKEEAQKKVDEINNLYWYKGVERAVLLENDTYRVILTDSTGADFIANNGVSKEFIIEDFGEEFGNFLLDYKPRIANIQPDYRVVPIKEIGVQPTQTNETLKESIDSVKSRTGYKITIEPISKETYEKAIEDSYSQSNGMIGEWTEDGLVYFVDLNDTVRLRRDKSGYFKESGINSEYTSQALINTKIAALKEVAKKYPRSLIRSEVKQRISSTLFTSEDYDLPFQKIPSANQINEPDTTISRNQRVSPLISFIGDKAREKTITSSSSKKLSDIFSDSKKMVWGTLSDNSTTGYDFEKSLQLSSDTIKSYSPLYERLSGISIQSVFDKDFSKMEREYKTLSFIVEGLYSNSFNGKLFDFIKSKLGDIQIRVTDSLDRSMFVYDGNLYINPKQLVNQLETDKLPNIEEYLNIVVSEELIHLIFLKQLSENDYKIVGEHLESNPSILNRVVQIYNFDTPLIGRQVVDEYLRMLVQDRVFGTTTELVRVAELSQFKKWFTDLWNFIKDFFKREYPAEIKTVVDPAIEFIEDSQQKFYQLGSDSLSTEITPELKSNLEQFAFKLNPDFKIEVLDDLLSQKGVNGIAQIKNFTIQLQKGKEGALSEEVSHFLIELMKDDNPLKKTMRDEVTRTRLYKKVVADYKKIYGNDIDRLKRETMAKLVSLYLTDKELFKYWTGSDSLVENVIRWIKDFFRWVKGETTSIGAFIKSAEKIINLDTSGLYKERSMMLEDMYSLGDFVKEATVLTTVGNVNTKRYPKVFINLNDTVFNSLGYPWKNKGEKSKVLRGLDMNALGEYYAKVEFTQLGKELQDKAQVIENLEFYTSLPSHPNLIERLNLLFPGVEINFVNREEQVIDEQGNPLTVTKNPVEGLIENNKESLFIDNKPPYAGKDFKFKLYQESKVKQPYEPFLDRVKRKDRIEAQKSNIQTLLKTLKGADQPTLTKSIGRAFKIITSESKDITRLEQRLGKQIDEEFSSLFRDEGDLLLPTTKAAQGKQLLDKIEKYEELLTHFVGTLEAMTEFFRRRNNADYENIKNRIASGNQKDIDIAIQELALVTKMGNKWRDYIDDLREVTKNVPNTDILNSLLGELLTQIESTKLKSRDLSVKVIASKLAPYLDSYNLHKQFEIDELKERLAKAPEGNKVEIQKSIDKLEKIKDKEGHFVSAEDIVKILNGEAEDISPLTMWVKVLHNSSDPLIGTLFVHLEKIKATVSVDELAPAQRLGQFISDEEAKSGLTSKEWQDKILYLDDTLEYENGKMVPKKAWTLLHPYMNEWKRDEKQYEVRQAKEKWLEIKNNNSSSKEEIKKAHEEYIKIRDDFDKWLTINWHREYKPEFYTKYDALLEENKELFEEIREEQSSIYDKIRELSDNARMEEGLSLRETNRKILALRNELKEMKRPTYSNGDPKVGKDLEKALFLQRKAEIDREFYEYKPDVSKFRVEFQVFLTTLLLSPEIKDTLELKLIEGKDNFINLYKYAKEKNLIDVIEWLDNNTVTKFHQDWYNQRKEISDQIQTLTDRVIEITGVDNKSKLGDLWEQMFNLTSHLRDEDNVFDGIQSTPEIQKLVKEIDEEIEEIKRLTREESKEIKNSELKEVKKQIRDLVSKLDEIQSKDVTDSYKDAFNEMITRTGFADLHNDSASYMWVQGLKITDFITRPDFHKTLRENPDHKFTKWFYDNHFLKTKFTPEGESKRWTPTYIWHKIEPVNSEYILLSPSHKYSNQTVREKWHTEKIPLTFNERLNRWNPKSEEFQNPEYKRLLNSSDPKDVAASRILKQVTDYHLNTQASTTIAEGNIGYVLPYIKKQVYEEGYLKSLKKDFFDSSNRFEEGAGNYDEQASKMPGFKRIKDKFLAWWRNQEQEEESKTDTERALRVAVPFTKYHEPDVVSKDVLMSVIRFSASTKTADKLMKSLPIISLIENSMVTNSKTKNRLNALRFGKENIIYGINQQEEVGKFAENTLRTIRKINTIGSLGFNIPNVVKNNLQGRLQNMIGAQFGDWSSNKAMTKASLNFRTSYAHYLSQADKPPKERDKDYHIITWLDPSLDSNIFNNLSKGATLKNLSTKGIMAFNEMMEFSISVNLMYARLYHVQVKNDKGEQKSLYDIITSDEVMGVEPGWKDIKTGRTVDMDYMMETRLAYKTVVEYVQGRVSNKTFLSTTTIGQAVLYFKNWLIPMLRRRFDKKRANYMMGEDFEGYWWVFFKSSLNLLRDILTTGRANWHAMTPREQREYITAVKEIGVMMATLAILSLVFGFEADDPDKFKKLKKNSFAENYAILMIIQAKNETEALSAMPFFNLEESVVPPVLTEGVKWLESPTIGLSIFSNTWKLTNSLHDLVMGSPDAYYQRNMPQFDIEKGDTKFFRHLLKITQFDDILINEDPEQKIRSVISNIKR